MRSAILFSVLLATQVFGQSKPSWTPQEQPVVDQIRTLRKVPDDQRGDVTRKLAQRVRQLPAGGHKVSLTYQLASLSTEGDFGKTTLQEVGTTLAEALRETPLPDQNGEPAGPYMSLAQLVRYEGIHVSIDSPSFQSALVKLDSDAKRRASADFTLTDMNGKDWKLSDLRGKVVLVNFWATWCPPCRKEIPDLSQIYKDFASKGLVILAISDEDSAKVALFLKEHPVPYTILLDPGRKVNELFAVEGIPKSFVYNREGKLVATAIDMRTKGSSSRCCRKRDWNKICWPAKGPACQAKGLTHYFCDLPFSLRAAS